MSIEKIDIEQAKDSAMWVAELVGKVNSLIDICNTQQEKINDPENKISQIIPDLL